MNAKAKIQVGLVYSGKIGGAWLPVRIDKSLGHGRYEATAMPGGKTVKISTDNIRGDGAEIEKWKADRAPKEHNLPVPTAAEVAASKTKSKKAPKPAKDRKPSGLDSAVAVLAEAGKPMNTGDMVKRMLETGMWKTNGKTPAATIYAAIITEIAKKGNQSRFRKTDRGMFELTAAGIASCTVAGKEVK